MIVYIDARLCHSHKKFVDGNCIDSCYIKNLCGNFTSCHTRGHKTYCSCIRGYTGYPINKCFKMDEESPCNPDPCGPNSVCIVQDPKIGPHCKCKDGFFGWAPNCRFGCTTDDQCGPTEICNKENKCEEMCDHSRCGENSICTLYKSKRNVQCSCKHGFILEKHVGCRLKLSTDIEIPTDPICENYCGFLASCNVNKGKIECFCPVGNDYEEIKPFKICTALETILSHHLVAVLSG